MDKKINLKEVNEKDKEKDIKKGEEPGQPKKKGGCCCG